MIEDFLIVRIENEWAFWEFSTSSWEEGRFCTGWRSGFLSRREFSSLYNAR